MDTVYRVQSRARGSGTWQRLRRPHRRTGRGWRNADPKLDAEARLPRDHEHRRRPFSLLCAHRATESPVGVVEGTSMEVTTRPDPGLAGLALRCAACGHDHALAELAWRCAACGGVLDLAGFTPVIPALSALAGAPSTLWRYAAALPVAEPADLSLGEGMTPLVAAPGRPDVLLKIDYLMPTGSFKDRGAVVLIALARKLDVPRMIADSSGNAGTAVAAYAARAGIPCEVYVPATTSAGKVAQLRAYGAAVRQVAGSREDTAAAAMEAAERPGTFYASHVYHPFFLHGTKTYVLELWEQLGGRLPGILVLPVGNGTLVLGAYLACRELLGQGLIAAIPPIVAVQAADCAPLASAISRGLAAPDEIDAKETIAEGIAIARPARGKQILAAVRDTGGTIITVTDDQVRAAHAALARSGLYVEPTAAACWAAIQAGHIDSRQVPGDRPRAVAPLCGSGLKSKPPAS
jgi:threonine synthase